MKVYLAKVNSDLTEGRGPMRTVGIFSKAEDAVEAIQGWGVMGVGHGEVYEAPVYDKPTKISEGYRTYSFETLIYGRRKRPDGKHDEGYTDFRDLTADPDYAKYLELKKRFEGK